MIHPARNRVEEYGIEFKFRKLEILNSEFGSIFDIRISISDF